MIPPNFSLFSVVLEIRKQRPMAIQTEVWAGSPHSKDTSLLLLSSLLNDLSSPLPTTPGAVQVPVPHSGSDVSLSATECQPSLPEPQGGTKAPFQPSETRTQSKAPRPPLWQHPALGLLPVAGTDSDISLCHPPRFLIRVSPLKLPRQRPQWSPLGAWTASSEASCPSRPCLSPRIVSHSTMTPSPSGLPRPWMPSPAHPAESSGTWPHSWSLPFPVSSSWRLALSSPLKHWRHPCRSVHQIYTSPVFELSSGNLSEDDSLISRSHCIRPYPYIPPKLLIQQIFLDAAKLSGLISGVADFSPWSETSSPFWDFPLLPFRCHFLIHLFNKQLHRNDHSSITPRPMHLPTAPFLHPSNLLGP